MKIELLTTDNFSVASLDDFKRTQRVKRSYRKIDGSYKIVEHEYIMDWSPEKKREVASELLSDSCIAYLAIERDRIIGFASVSKTKVDGYMIAELIQVDADMRRRGIGRRLFAALLDEARRANAKGLYISACSSEETVGFYLAMGCRITDTPIESLAAAEPCDVQMEYLF